MVITIDGPAGAGKSTVAQALAKQLKFAYLDTGAMYRALTLKALRQKINPEDKTQIVNLARESAIDICTDDKNRLKVLLDNEDVSQQIRTPEVTRSTFYIAQIPEVRQIMVSHQRKIGEKRDIVVEGRDIGTVVFPQAAKKFYLDADFEERARRRYEELKAQGKQVDEAALKKELKERDTKDLTRSAGPLKKAEDAIIIDSTHLSAAQVVEKILMHLKKVI